MSQIQFDRDTSLGQALFAPFARKDKFLVLKDSDGVIEWSGILKGTTFYGDHATAEFTPVEEHVTKVVQQHEDIMRFTLERLGVL